MGNVNRFNVSHPLWQGRSQRSACFLVPAKSEKRARAARPASQPASTLKPHKRPIPVRLPTVHLQAPHVSNNNLTRLPHKEHNPSCTISGSQLTPRSKAKQGRWSPLSGPTPFPSGRHAARDLTLRPRFTAHALHLQLGWAAGVWPRRAWQPSPQFRLKAQAQEACAYAPCDPMGRHHTDGNSQPWRVGLLGGELRDDMIRLAVILPR